MDLQTIIQLWTALSPAAQAVCTGAVGNLLGNLPVEAARALTKREPGMVFAGLYRKWRDGMLRSADDAKLNTAFVEFFARQPTRQEFDKFLRGAYADVNFETLESQFVESCDWAKCAIPEGDLYSMLEDWASSLDAFLNESYEYRTHHQPAIHRSLEALRRTEPGLRNHSLARRAYLRHLQSSFQQIQLRGFDSVNELTDVELEKVFVVPRLQAGRMESDQSKPIPAGDLLTNPAAPKRIVILGKPGAGKTTLLWYFTLRLAKEKEGALLPVFYRALDYQEDRDRNPGHDFWECFHERLAADCSLRLPFGFFDRQKANGVAVMVDGLDEVADDAKRIKIVEAVSNMANRLPPGCRFLVTSRPHEYARSPFLSNSYTHFSLVDFNDDEIKQFIANWRGVHDSTVGAAIRASRDLWAALEAQPRMKEMAGNALLLTMIVRVHWWLGQLPEGRLKLYETCSNALVHHWSVVHGLKLDGIGLEHKREFLAGLAYSMQSSAQPGELNNKVGLRISLTQLKLRLESFLNRKKLNAALLDPLLDRLHTRDAILVNFGGGQFGFVHRSFQEYFAACFIAEKKGQQEIRDRLKSSGWEETLYMAAAQLPSREREPLLLELLGKSRVEFAFGCAELSPNQDGWVERLTRFLAKCTWPGRDHSGLSASECIDDENEEATLAVGAKIFKDRLDGQALAAALELAEELKSRGNAEAAAIVDGFFSEARRLEHEGKLRMDMIPIPAGTFRYGEKPGKNVHLDAFLIDRHPVTNAEFELMVPGQRQLSDEYSNEDRQPVTYVNWYEAQLFARWRGCRLPSEEEWEKAASWDPHTKQKREYPWGGGFDKSRCNTRESGIGKTTPIGSYPNGKSAYGCEDMAGNVWEWTEREGQLESGIRVLRGGSWFTSSMSSPAALVAAATTRRSVASASGSVAPGHNLPSSLFHFYPLYSGTHENARGAGRSPAGKFF